MTGPGVAEERRLATRIALIVCLVAVAFAVIALATSHSHETSCIDYAAGSGHQSRCVTR